MKNYFYSALLILAPLFSYSQRKLTNIDSPDEKYNCLPIKFSKRVNASNLKLPASDFELIDARADTSKLGFFYNYSALKMMKLCLANGANEIDDFIDHFLQNNFTPSSSSVVLSLRKFWVGSYDTLIKDKPSIKIQMVFLKAEFYLNQSGCYYPLYRFDSSIIFKTDNDKLMSGIIEDILIASLRRVLSFDYGKVKNLACINRPALDSFNLARSHFIVLTTTPAKGVYLNLAQFRNNSPAFADFEILSGKASDQIFVKGKTGIDSLIGGAWGYSDGEISYCRFGYNFFPLFKCGKNFDLYAPKNFIMQNPLIQSYTPMSTETYGAASGLAGLATAELLSMIKTTSIKLKPMQLDLETGKFY